MVGSTWPPDGTEELERYPLDFDALDRGDVIPPERIERAYGIKRSDYKRYQLALMTLKGEIWAHKGGAISIKQEGDGLRLLTGDEQNEYVQQDQLVAIRRFARRHFEDLHNNDLSRLSAEDLKRREERLLKNSWKLQALRSRSVPKLEDKKRRRKKREDS